MARVLLVEDQPGIQRFVSRSLTSEGIAVDVAGDGTRGLQAAREGHHDLILLDLMLPDADGMDVLAQMLAFNPHQQVMILSALSDVSVKVRCLDQGAVDYVGKPFALAELLARVRARLRAPAPAEAGSTESRWLRSGGVALDRQRRLVRVADRESSLSQREFLLLEYLMTHAEAVCTRDRLLAEVWGYSFDPGSNVVDVYVRRLRGKLDAHRIETIRNVGYLFQGA